MYAKEIITDPSLVKFWEKAIKSGTHLVPPPRFSTECWERRLGIAWEYVFTNRTLREIGQDHGISYEYVRKIAHETTHSIWGLSKRSFKKKYPLCHLALRKVIATAV